MKFKGECPRCHGQLIEEDDEVYCFNCAHRPPALSEMIYDEEIQAYRPMTTAERLRVAGPKRLPHKKYRPRLQAS